VPDVRPASLSVIPVSALYSDTGQDPLFPELRDEMSFQISAAEFTARYRESLRMCAADRQVADDGIRVLRIEMHYKSALVYLSPAGGADEPSHVVKINANQSWDPRREFDGLSFIEKAFPGTHSLEGHDLGAITPVGCGRSPAFLVTRYQPGKSVRETFDRAILGLGNRAKVEESKTYCRIIAYWLQVFRDHGSSPGRPGEDDSESGHGVDPKKYLQTCEANVGELKRAFRDKRPLENVLDCARRYMEQLSEDDGRAMARSYPFHGDFAPQNFHVDDQGKVYVLDLGSFRHVPLDIDVAGFRIRMEHYCLRGPLARRRAQEIWEAFLETYLSGGTPKTFVLYCYVHHLLARLRTMRDPQQQVVNRSLKTRLKNALWSRNRLRWIGKLTGDVEADSARLRSKL